MDTKHTPEKWYVERSIDGLGSNLGTLIANVLDNKGEDVLIGLQSDYGDIGQIDAQANAALIVACVNGCAGINPDEVPDLLAALRRIAALNENAGEIGAGMLHTIVSEARAALAKAEQ